MAYNLTLINGTGVVPFLQTVNEELMFGWYGNLGLIALFLILYMGFQAYTNNFKKSIGIASLLVAIASVMFHSMSFVPAGTVLLCWVLAALIAGISFITPE